MSSSSSSSSYSSEDDNQFQIDPMGSMPPMDPMMAPIDNIDPMIAPMDPMAPIDPMGDIEDVNQAVIEEGAVDEGVVYAPQKSSSSSSSYSSSNEEVIETVTTTTTTITRTVTYVVETEETDAPVIPDMPPIDVPQINDVPQISQINDVPQMPEMNVMPPMPEMQENEQNKTSTSSSFSSEDSQNENENENEIVPPVVAPVVAPVNPPPNDMSLLMSMNLEPEDITPMGDPMVSTTSTTLNPLALAPVAIAAGALIDKTSSSSSSSSSDDDEKPIEVKPVDVDVMRSSGVRKSMKKSSKMPEMEPVNQGDVQQQTNDGIPMAQIAPNDDEDAPIIVKPTTEEPEESRFKRKIHSLRDDPNKCSTWALVICIIGVIFPPLLCVLFCATTGTYNHKNVALGCVGLIHTILYGYLCYCAIISCLALYFIIYLSLELLPSLSSGSGKNSTASAINPIHIDL